MGVVGEKTEHTVAEQTVVVQNPESGIHQQIFAGKVVPPNLVEAYEEAVSGGKKGGKKAPEAPEPDNDSDDAETAEDLNGLNRKALDERAAELGVSEPEKLAKKADVIAAIQAAEA